MMGGIIVDAEGRTSLPRLWAAGEVTSSGLHGANRLASNSLLEGIVYGASSGRGASEAARLIPDDLQALPLRNAAVPETAEPLDLSDIRNTLKSMLWRAAGVQRVRTDLAEARLAIDSWCRIVLARQFQDPAGWELQNMIAVAKLIVESALRREESRGVHLRSDFPHTVNPDWCRHLILRRQTTEDA